MLDTFTVLVAIALIGYALGRCASASSTCHSPVRP
jgi:hypothetical protein